MSNKNLMKASARYILGESTGVQIKGSSERIKTFQEVLTASKDLYDALCEERSLDEIVTLSETKKKAAADFRKITGITWRL
jgi:hypothetical protein